MSKRLLTIVVLATLIVGCNDSKKSKISDGNKIDQTQNDSFMSAKIDGKYFYIDAPIYFSSQNIITLAAVSKDETEKIRMYINYNNGPSTYTFGKGISNSDNMVYTKDKMDWLAAKTDGEGTITFTEDGGYLKATFSFTGVHKETKKTIQITDGKLKVQINS